jgi:hypothetical protein
MRVVHMGKKHTALFKDPKKETPSENGCVSTDIHQIKRKLASLRHK